MKFGYIFSGMMIMAGLAGPALADVKYLSDPLYKPMSDDDPPAMVEMQDLAAQGDPRAQFILGDMYEKGKGGLPKDWKLARRWFEESGMHGYGHSFIRLAAMAKSEKDGVGAWQWYTLAISNLDNDDVQQHAVQARKDVGEKFALTKDDIRTAEKAVDEWEDKRDQHLRDEKKAEKEKAEQHDNNQESEE